RRRRMVNPPRLRRRAQPAPGTMRPAGVRAQRRVPASGAGCSGGPGSRRRRSCAAAALVGSAGGGASGCNRTRPRPRRASAARDRRSRARAPAPPPRPRTPGQRAGRSAPTLARGNASGRGDRAGSSLASSPGEILDARQRLAAADQGAEPSASDGSGAALAHALARRAVLPKPVVVAVRGHGLVGDELAAVLVLPHPDGDHAFRVDRGALQALPLALLVVVRDQNSAVGPDLALTLPAFHCSSASRRTRRPSATRPSS